jgi:hypothetical protein
LRRIVSKNHRTTAELGDWTEELNVHLEDQVSTKTVRREFHKSNIHGRAVSARSLITGSNVQMRKQLYHDNKTSTSDN